MAAGASAIVVSRAGSTIFEIASWNLPSIIIPLPESISHDQTKNALAYARKGACTMIEERNITPHIFISEIDRIINNPQEQARMKEAAQHFSQPDAAVKIARVIFDLALEHES
jgi:UDP-N-acetylglucosamine--N-acetylmuramyl-(pentapeptide) pyrophosphoryl-undecaprenol N-acetylglucosamine transferase